jgi:hypothetical protein
LDNKEWKFGEATLSGGTAGVLGAVAQSVPVASLGALTAGTSTLLSTYYGTEKQTDAYLKAFGAADCVRSLASGINHEAALKQIKAPAGGGTANQYAGEKLNAALDKIHHILFGRLQKRAVSTAPNFEQFQTHLQNSLVSKPAAASKDVKTSPKNADMLALAVDANGSAIEEIDVAEFERLKAAVGRLQDDIGLCISAN